MRVSIRKMIGLWGFLWLVSALSKAVITGVLVACSVPVYRATGNIALFFMIPGLFVASLFCLFMCFSEIADRVNRLQMWVDICKILKEDTEEDTDQ